MVYHLAQLYGQPLTAQRFLEIASTLGLGLLLRQGTRTLLEMYSVHWTRRSARWPGGTLAGASTFALGKAFCYYYRAVHQGHVPKTEELRRYYREQFSAGGTSLETQTLTCGGWPMSRWRVVVVIGLILTPILFLASTGSYYLWTLHWGFFAWWPLALCMGIGYTLGWYWQRKRLLLHPPDVIGSASLDRARQPRLATRSSPRASRRLFPRR